MFREGRRVALLVCSVLGLVLFILYKLYITDSETQAELLQLRVESRMALAELRAQQQRVDHKVAQLVTDRDRADDERIQSTVTFKRDLHHPPRYKVAPYQPQYTYHSDRYLPGEDGTFAQNLQDVWFERLAEYNGWLKRPGFYLDLGAFHPYRCSNSALLDLKYSWRGICVEPRPNIRFDGRSCVVVNRPLSGESGVSVQMGGQADDSQIFGIDHRGSPEHATLQKTLNAGGLIDCVANRTDCEGVHGRVDIPKVIEFVSMDVEGQEHLLLATWPWDRVKVGVFIIENPGNKEEHNIVRDIMQKRGYIKTDTENAGVDEYYVLPEYWSHGVSNATKRRGSSLVQKKMRDHPPHSHGC